MVELLAEAAAVVFDRMDAHRRMQIYTKSTGIIGIIQYRRMERMKKRILIALALCMALGTACGKKEVEEEKTLRSVEVTTVGKGDIASEFSYTGKAAPAKEVSVVLPFPARC